MFFTPELLSKRDSGFGLLWLAATLGSRSTFKKLPKRSVLTADISQLCDLITEPEEPLALRLSSNLMFGVVRVYKVKQEIFLNDVTICVATLKKVVQELRSSGNVQLQMVNPTVRPALLTMIPDSREAYALDYDAFVADWDEYLNMEAATRTCSIDEDDDTDFDPTQSKKKSKTKSAVKSAPAVEVMRKEAHTLDEHHEHVLSASFDMSFSNNAEQVPSSSQADVPFDNFFPFSDGLDVGEGLGDDLARELGWATSPIKSVRSNRIMGNAEKEQHGLQFDEGDYNIGAIDFDFNTEDMHIFMDEPGRVAKNARPSTPVPQQAPKMAKNVKDPAAQRYFQMEWKSSLGPSSDSVQENAIPRLGSVVSQRQGPSPAMSFSRMLLSQDEEQPLRDITTEESNRHNQQDLTKKTKRTRLLLDARTELTDDELKIARAKYLESQRRQRRQLLSKKTEKDSGKFIEELIWSVPKGIQEPGLRNFWQENFKVQVEARSGVLRIHPEASSDEPPSKRRKIAIPPAIEEEPRNGFYNEEPVQHDVDWNMDWVVGNDVDMAVAVDQAGDNRNSSEEPGQARRISRSASILGASNLAFDLGPRGSGNGSQRSSFFPWDHAGPSSSSGNVPFAQPEVDHIVERVDVRLRSISTTRRESPIAGSRDSHRGSITGSNVLLSPAMGGRTSQILGEDFAFEVEEAVPQEDTQQETQKSEVNLVTLERNSFNFLEYAKMQYQTLPKPEGRLEFETVAPKSTSTSHVAAAAFYHCLVLATKNLVGLKQSEPYGRIFIDII
uniref:Rad21/Rec8-like protein N-terminal domain-containing protein n=1 Tax=Psilocybe cubensis TaxID=181762 RepID=A0A8H7Y7W3_PSICU